MKRYAGINQDNKLPPNKRYQYAAVRLDMQQVAHHCGALWQLILIIVATNSKYIWIYHQIDISTGLLEKCAGTKTLTSYV